MKLSKADKEFHKHYFGLLEPYQPVDELSKDDYSKVMINVIQTLKLRYESGKLSAKALQNLFEMERVSYSIGSYDDMPELKEEVSTFLDYYIYFVAK